MSPPLIFVVAGEPSGDALGARLIAALRRETAGAVEFVGIGGPEMEAVGLDSLFPMSELSVMGLVEILPHAVRILNRMRQAAAEVDRLRPDAVVTIDSPGFAHGLARRIRDRSIPRIHYVAPTVWAWRSGRVHKFKRHFDHLLCLFPFEPSYFEAVGLGCDFVGHSVLESGADKGDGVRFREARTISPTTTVICVLPGSRRSEIDRHLPVFGEAVTAFAAGRGDLAIVLPTVPGLRSHVKEAVAQWPAPVFVTEGREEKYDAMAASDAALAASGTVALELAMARVPTVVAYRMNALTVAIARRMIRVSHVAMLNLILARQGLEPVIPERLQEDFRADLLVRDLERLLDGDGAVQVEALQVALDTLNPPQGRPSTAAARAVLRIVAERAGVAGG